MEIESYRAELESFLSALHYEEYLHFSGQKEELNLAPIYQEHKELYSRQAINEISSLLAGEGAAEEAKRLRYLLAFAIENYLAHETRELIDRIATTEARLELELHGERVGYRYSSVVQMNEADRKRRSLIEQKRNELTSRELNPLLEEYWSRLHDLARELGYESYVAMFREVKGIDYEALKKDLMDFLARTEDLYRSVMDEVMESEIGIGLEQAKRSDLPYLLRGKSYDAYFDKKRMLEAFYLTLKGMGIDLNEQPNIRMDTEDRKTKSPRAFCAPVKVPDEVYLCLLPSGGQDDYEALLHEGGHAEHYGNASRREPVEFRYLGDKSVTEGFAFLFDHLTKNEAWLKRIVGMSDPRRFIRFSAAVDLMFFRRYVGKLHYETLLHDGTGVQGKEELYRDLIYKSCQIEHPSENYLKDVDESFYCAEYLRAWIFEAQLRTYLIGEHGDAWFADKKAGDLLREIWRYGQRYGVEEILAELGLGGLDLDCLVQSYLFLLGA